MRAKKYSHDWERVDGADYSPRELAMEVLEDEELLDLDKIIIGQYTPGYDMGIQDLLDTFIEHKDSLQHIDSFFFGDMDYMECEVSWIEQGNYREFLKAFPNIKELIIKGSQNLELGYINHKNLERLEIITGGLPREVIDDIRHSHLPSLNTLILYFGVDQYGFDGGIEDIKNLIERSDFPKLKELGLVNSELEDDIVDLVLKSSILSRLDILRLSYGSLTDKGGELLFENSNRLRHLEELDLEYNYLSEEMAEKLNTIGIKVNTGDRQEIDVDEYNGETYYYTYPLLTE